MFPKLFEFCFYVYLNQFSDTYLKANLTLKILDFLYFEIFEKRGIVENIGRNIIKDSVQNPQEGKLFSS